MMGGGKLGISPADLFSKMGAKGVSESQSKEFLDRTDFVSQEKLDDPHGFAFAFGLGKIISDTNTISIQLDARLLLLQEQDRNSALTDLLSHAITRIITHGIGLKIGIKEMQLGGEDNEKIAEEVVSTERLKVSADKVKSLR